VSETVSDEETFNVTPTAMAQGFANPKYIVGAYWHRNATGSKWATAGNTVLLYTQGTNALATNPSDPGTSYSRFSWGSRRGADQNKIELADVRDMEYGMNHGAGDNPDWRVSAVAGEMAWERIAAVQPMFM
jgi:hypothetical protein